MTVPRLSAAWDDSTRSFDGARALLLGREEHHDIVLRDSRVSRTHCELRPDGDRWSVVDLESRNGTWARGVRLESYTLQAGETVRLTMGGPDGPVVTLTAESAHVLPKRLGAPGKRTPTPHVAATIATAKLSASR